MTDRKVNLFLAEQFTRDLESLLNENENLIMIPSNEYEQLMGLSKVMLQTDWSNGRKTKGKLKEKMVALFLNNELSDDDLDLVAGGLQNQSEGELLKKDDEK